MSDYYDLYVSESLQESWRKFFSGKRVLITGASGLLGNYLARTLDHTFRYGSTKLELFLQVRSYLDTKDFCTNPKIINVDLADIPRKSIQNWDRFDVVVHAATYGQPTKFTKFPLETIKLNSQVTEMLISLVKPAGVFLFMSSSEVYSGLESGPFKEYQIGNTNTDHPRAPYIEGKRIGECLTNLSAILNPGTRMLSARVALAYGPGFRKDDTRVLNQFIIQALVDKKIVMRDSGKAMRTYCFLSDTVEMLLSLITSAETGIYNVGGTSRTSIVELAKRISTITDAELEIPNQADEFFRDAPKDVELDISKVLSILGKQEFVKLEEGLKLTVDWARNFLSTNG